MMNVTTVDKTRRIFLLTAFSMLLTCWCLVGLAQQAADSPADAALPDAQKPAASMAADEAVPAAAEAPAVVVADQAALAAAQSREAAGRPKRLRDYGLPGLQARVNLKSLDPWDVVQLVEFLAYRGGLNNIVIGKGIAGLTTKLKFEDVSVGDALEVVLSVNNLAYEINGGILTIMTDAEYRASHGMSFYDNRQVRVVELKYADPTRVKEMLTAMKSEAGVIVADPITGTLILIDTPEKIAAMRAVIEKADLSTVARILPTETRTFVLQYANVEEILPEVTALLTKEVGSIRSDKRTKTLMVTDLPHNLKRVEALVTAFDRRLKEVFIEAKIVQVTLKDEFRLGINWNHVFDGVDPRFSLGTTVATPIPDPFGDNPVHKGEGFGSLTYRAIVGGGDLSVILDALKTVGDTKILSNPHVAVIDGKEATIKVITDQPYAEASLESGTTNVVGVTLKFIEVGVILSVTPRISADDFISMAIKPEVSTVTGNYQAQYQVPIVRKSFAETSVMIKNGETVIIAGMIENQKGTATTSVPLLGRIPLVGLLFRSQAESTRTQETIVFLSPRIISGEEPVLLLRDTKKTPKPLRSAGWSEGKQLKSVR